MLADPAVIFATAAQKRCMEIAEEIVAIVRESPVTPTGATHQLRNGYRAVPEGAGAAIVTPVPYWHYVEFGTSKMAAEPHVRPAIEIVRRRHTR